MKAKTFENLMGRKPIRKPIRKHNFSNDNTLNDLLNETAMSSTNTESSMAPVNLSQPFASGAPLPMETAGMPESVVNAVTRDYSGLMEAINKKKNK